MRDASFTAAFLRRLGHRIASLFRGRRMDRDMDEEMRIHMELQTEEYRKEGMEPAEAALRARREFGHLDGISETCRDERGFLWIAQLGQDLRYGWRMLRRTPGFTAAAVLTLALGVGVNTAIFSLVDEILLRQMPVRDPDGLVLFHWASRKDFQVPVGGSWENDPSTHLWTCTSFSMPVFEQLRKRDDALAGIFAFAPISRMTVVADGNAEVVRLGELISGGGFSVLGIIPFAGRTIGEADDRPGAAPVAMISYRYWQSRFGGDPAVLGSSMSVNRLPVTVVGIAPRHFSGTLQVGDSPDMYLPLSLADRLGGVGPGGDLANSAGFWWLQMIGRSRTGETHAQIRASLEGTLQRCAAESLAAVGSAVPADRADLPKLVVGPGGQGLSEIRHQYTRQWTILAALGIAVLAIACANIASLLLARGASRQREVGVRLAMGASRGRIVRQLITEGALLAGMGGALAVPIALWVEQALVAMQPKLEGHSLAIVPHLDPRIFATAALLSMLTGMLFGIAPAIRATRVDIVAEFQGGTHNRGGGSRSALGKALIIVQVALSMVLLVGTGLFARTLINLHGVDVGFDRERLLLFQANPNPTGTGLEAGEIKDRSVAEALRSVPGVISVTYSKMPLLSDMGWNTRVRVPGRPKPAGDGDTAMVNAVSEDFFGTYGIPIVAGRAIGRRDQAGGPKVAVINQAMAKAFFGEEDPVGRIIEEEVFNQKPIPIEILGIARDAKYSAVRQAVPPTIYFPFHAPGSESSAEATFAVRTSGDPEKAASMVRAAVHSVDPLLPLDDMRTQEAQIADLSANEHMFAWLSGLFSSLALGLVSLGLYGLMSFAVLRRTGEIGLRMALGADASGVLRMVLRESLSVTAIGVVVGLAGAFAATRIIANLLFGLTATDPVTYAASALLLFGTAVLAAWIPARRASRVDPMVALRCD